MVYKISGKEIIEAKKQRVKNIITLLKKEYPQAKCSLDFRNPLQLLISTILSAQCTDKRVNLVTPTLCKRFKTAVDFAQVPQKELEKFIRSTGFFRNKARSIKACCRMIIDKYNGRVPKNMQELLTLNGIGRKTANVVLGAAYGIASGIAVDTHVTRLAGRLKLSPAKNQDKIERDLMEIVPKSDWIIFTHLLIAHGRKVCQARKPRCAECVINSYCPASTV